MIVEGKSRPRGIWENCEKEVGSSRKNTPSPRGKCAVLNKYSCAQQNYYNERRRDSSWCNARNTEKDRKRGKQGRRTETSRMVHRTPVVAEVIVLVVE